MTIERKDFPYTTEFMEKHLFQESADSMEEAILQYKQNGEDYVSALLREIDTLLSGKFSETELYDYVDQYSDYDVDDSGVKTLDFIRKVLKREPHDEI